MVHFSNHVAIAKVNFRYFPEKISKTLRSLFQFRALTSLFYQKDCPINGTFLTKYLFVENQFLYKNNSVTIDFKKHPINLVDKPTIEDILRTVTEEVKVVYNINPNAILFFEDISKPIMKPSRYEYFDFITSFEIYEPFYRNL